MESSNLTTIDEAAAPSIYLMPVPWDWRLILQLILAIVGIIVNSVVIHVYLHTRKLTMSATSRFIAALAVADIVTSISIIPIPALSFVPDSFGGHIYCRIVFSPFVMWASIVASICFLTILALERFIAIAIPIQYRRIFTVKMTNVIIGTTWLFSAAFNTFAIYTVHLNTVTGTCFVDFSHLGTGFQMFIGVSTFVIEYLAPVSLMLFANVRSNQLLKRRAQMFTTKSQQKNLDLIKARQRIIYMLLVVIICFIICWSQDQFAFLAFNLGLMPVEYIHGNLYRFFIVLAFANSCINPVLYTLTNKNFRRAIKQHLFCCSARGSEPVNGVFDSPLETEHGSASIDDSNILATIKHVSASPSASRNNSNDAMGNNV